MSMEDFNTIEPLGKGSFGSVFKVVRKSNGQVYAIKQVPFVVYRSNCKN